jgi:antitoxin (DNA-binding transcriptional repressor) of toxin-antitoxin stability system
MTTVAVTELRTKFSRLKALIAREGQVIVTDRGRPASVLRAFSASPTMKPAKFDYFARLTSRQPRALSWAASKALDEDAVASVEDVSVPERVAAPLRARRSVSGVRGLEGRVQGALPTLATSSRT